jgi:hypothetical protein
VASLPASRGRWLSHSDAYKRERVEPSPPLLIGRMSFN